MAQCEECGAELTPDDGPGRVCAECMASVLADDTVDQEPTQFEPLDSMEAEEGTIDLSGEASEGGINLTDENFTPDEPTDDGLNDDEDSGTLDLSGEEDEGTLDLSGEEPPVPSASGDSASQEPASKPDPDSWELSDGTPGDSTQDEQLTAFEDPADQDESATELFMELDKPEDLGRQTELEPFSTELPLPGSGSDDASSGAASSHGTGDAVVGDPGPTPVQPGPGEPNIRAVEDDPNKPPSLHGGEVGPLTRMGADSFTRHEEPTPALPSDSDERATVELDQKIKELWRGVEADGGSSSPSATLRVDNMPHLDSDSILSVSERPIAYPEAEPGDKADYRVEKFIAKGGMGRVYRAQQTSLGRIVALKTLSDDLSKKNRYRRKFFAEASITGRLDHPNIVPIHDLGVRADGVPFYSMKLVTGEAWDKSINKRGKTENVNILLRVADAMAFAHDKQILHRDLKPENVMLGEYGEVLVVDWGLAIHLERDRDFALGGTPLYMAPEMANHDVPLIGVRSDVYLMGAMLYEILEGKAPHASGAKTATERLLVAAMNQIEPHESVDELIDVALKAMATNPSDRYQTVLEFQEAIKECQRHADSRERSERAAKELREARATGENERYSRAMFAFQEAIDMWPENGSARDGLRATRLAYAENALENQDYALGLSLLDPSEPEHQTVYKQLTEAQRQEQSRGRRLKIARMSAIGATLATVVSLIGLAFYHYNASEKQAVLTAEAVVARDAAKKSEGDAVKARDDARKAEKKALDARDDAKKAEKDALDARDDAKKAEKEALDARDDAKKAEKDAVDARDDAKKSEAAAIVARDEAKRRAFAVQLTLTATELAAFDIDSADDRLRALEADPQYSQLLDWEADRLRYLAHRDFDREQIDTAAMAFAPSPSGERFASLAPGGLKLSSYDPQTKGITLDETHDLKIASPRCVALGPNNTIAVGGAAVSQGAPLVEIGRTGPSDKRLVLPSPGPNWKVTALAFSPTGDEVAVAHHAPLAVRVQIINLRSDSQQLDPKLDTPQDYALSGLGAYNALTFSADGLRLAAAESSRETGQSNVTVWSRGSLSEPFAGKVKLSARVRSLAFHPTNNRLLACGGVGGELILWTIDPTTTESDTGNVVRLDRHTDDITQLSFSPSGDSLVTASASGLALVWSPTGAGGQWAVDQRPPLRHSSPLRGTSWAGDGETLITADAEGTVRTWPLDAYYNVRRWSTSDATPARTIAATHKDRLVVVGDENGHTQLLDASTSDPRPRADFFIGHSGSSIANVWSIADAAGGRDRLVTLGFDGGQATLYRWAANLRAKIGGINAKQSFDLSPSGKHLIVAGLQKLSLLYASNGKELDFDTLSVSSMAYLPTGDRLVVGDARGRLSVLSTRTGKFEAVARDTIAARRDLRWLATTRIADSDLVYAATGETEPTVFRVGMTDGQAAMDATPLPKLALPVRSLACAGETVVALCGERGALFVYRGGATEWTRLATAEINSAAALTDGGVIAARADGALQYWSPRPGSESVQLSLPRDTTYDRVGQLASGEAFASGRRSGRPVVDTWRPGAAQRPTRAYESRSPVVLATVPNAVEARSEALQVATLSRDGYYRTWSMNLPVRQPASTTSLVAGGTEILDAAASSDNAVLCALAMTNGTVSAHLLQSAESNWQTLELPAGEKLSAATSCAIQGDRMVIWDAARNKLFDWRLDQPRPPTVWNGPPAAADQTDSLPVAIDHRGRVAVLLSTPQGKQIALLGENQQVRLYQLKQSNITSLAFSPSGDRLLAGAGSGAIRLYDVSGMAGQQPDAGQAATTSLTELATFTEHRRPVVTLRFSPTGETLLSGDSQGQVILWPSDPLADRPGPAGGDATLSATGR